MIAWRWAFAGLVSVSIAAPAIAGGTCDTCVRREVTPPLMVDTPHHTVVRPGWRTRQYVPAQVSTVRENIIVRPAHVVARHVPAHVGVVHERVQVTPARRVAARSYDAYGNQIICDRTVGPEYATVARHVVVPARIEHVTVPAEVRTVTRRVVTRPAHVVTHEMPPEIHTFPRRTLLQGPTERWVPTAQWQPHQPNFTW